MRVESVISRKQRLFVCSRPTCVKYVYAMENMAQKASQKMSVVNGVVKTNNIQTSRKNIESQV